MLVGFGHRRGGSFLGQNHSTLVPVFGLRNRAILSPLAFKTNIDRGINYSREVAAVISLQGDESLISVASRINCLSHYEYALDVPHKIGSNKRSMDGLLNQETNSLSLA
jgi:hypothetical protein